MRVKTIVDEDFVNYKTPSMFIGTISCNGKCCFEGGFPLSVCQNDGWRGCAPIDIRDEVIIKRYLQNPLTHSIVFGGLEPIEQAVEVGSYRVSVSIELIDSDNYDIVNSTVQPYLDFSIQKRVINASSFTWDVDGEVEEKTQSSITYIYYGDKNEPHLKSELVLENKAKHKHRRGE